MASRGPRGTFAQTELDRMAATVEEVRKGRAAEVSAVLNMVRVMEMGSSKTITLVSRVSINYTNLPTID